MKLTFFKYSGNGNDFIILDHPPITPPSEVLKSLCDRHFGIGADGVLILSSIPGADAQMQIFNADGGEAEMCGNGLRCLVTYFDDTISTKKESYFIKTMNALYTVVRKEDSFALEMGEVKDQNKIPTADFTYFEKSFYVNTGVPHLIFLTPDALKVDIKRDAPLYRFDSRFPQGTNVSFLNVVNEKEQRAYVRTYERGVEDVTFSCGTGLTASALALQEWFGWKGEIRLETKGGQHLVEIGNKILYSGSVKFCFKGEVEV